MHNKKVRVLIVEDDPAVISFLQILLEGEGFEVKSALGWAALDLAEEFEPDIILLDIMMPVMNGLEWSNRAKANPLLRKIPIIVLSAAPVEDLKTKYMNLEASSFLAKPFNLDCLLNLVYAYVNLPQNTPGSFDYV